MPKITSSNTKPLFIKYAVKIILSTVLSVFLLSCLASLFVLKLDISLDILDYTGAVITVISSAVIVLVSLTVFKNNYLILSLISVLPLFIFTLINSLVNKNVFILVLIKMLGIILSAVIIALIKSGKKSR